MALNGLRISEALGADIDQLDFERGHRTLLVHRKGGKTVTIPLAPRTARALDLAIGERLEGPIFLGHDGQRLTRDSAARMVRRLAKRAEITKRIGPHSPRHSFITAALDAGVPLRDVQEAASHADRGRRCATTEPAIRWTDTPPTSLPPSSPAPAAATPPRQRAAAEVKGNGALCNPCSVTPTRRAALSSVRVDLTQEEPAVGAARSELQRRLVIGL